MEEGVFLVSVFEWDFVCVCKGSYSLILVVIRHKKIPIFFQLKIG